MTTQNKISLIITEEPQEEGPNALDLQIEMGKDTDWTGPAGRLLAFCLSAIVTGAEDASLISPLGRKVLDYHINSALQELEEANADSE